MPRAFEMTAATRDLLAFYDRKNDHGWTAADVERLNEIREMVNI